MAMERTKQLKFYCPQRSWGKVIFLHMYVILFMGDVCLSACWDTHLLPGADPPPEADTPSEQTPPQSRHPMGADTPQSSACLEIWATSRWYASYWNAILFPLPSLCECCNLLPWYPFFLLPSWMGIEPICHAIKMKVMALVTPSPLVAIKRPARWQSYIYLSMYI